MKNLFLTFTILTFITVGLSAQSESDFDTTINSDGKSIMINKYYGNATTVKIPDKIKNLPVTIINGFDHSDSITSVIIPNSVTIIGFGAFFSSNLSSVNIPDSVTSIEYAAFSNTSLISVTVPDSVTSIGESIFSFCRSLTSVIIGNSVTKISNSAFSNCTSLTSVTIGKNVTSIGREAFNGCSSLTNIIIPKNVTSIDWGAFINCKNLASVTFQGAIDSKNFEKDSFLYLGDLRSKYLNGGIGTYITSNPGKEYSIWTKK